MTTTTTSEKPERPHSLSLRVSDEELDWLRQKAVSEDRTISGLLRLALREYVEKRA